MYDALFGRVTARCILYIVNYGDGHAGDIARTFGLSGSSVRRSLRQLEDDGVLVAVNIGNVRLFQLNPRSAIRKELTALCERILEFLPDEDTMSYFRQRRRPRRTGKEF